MQLSYNIIVGRWPVSVVYQPLVLMKLGHAGHGRFFQSIDNNISTIDNLPDDATVQTINNNEQPLANTTDPSSLDIITTNINTSLPRVPDSQDNICLPRVADQTNNNNNTYKHLTRNIWLSTRVSIQYRTIKTPGGLVTLLRKELKSLVIFQMLTKVFVIMFLVLKI